MQKGKKKACFFQLKQLFLHGYQKKMGSFRPEAAHLL
jgi:hypothetical protein